MRGMLNPTLFRWGDDLRWAATIHPPSCRARPGIHRATVPHLGCEGVDPGTSPGWRWVRGGRWPGHGPPRS